MFSDVRHSEKNSVVRFDSWRWYGENYSVWCRDSLDGVKAEEAKGEEKEGNKKKEKSITDSGVETE